MNVNVKTPKGRHRLWAAAPLLALLPWASGCESRVASAKDAPPEPLVAAELGVVVDAPVPQKLILTGSLAAHQRADVAADAGGKVVRTFVERGAFVKKGDPLVELDSRGARLAQTEAEAQARAARAQREQADTDCARAEELFGKAAINRADYERLKTQCEASRWSSSAAAARAELANKSLGDTVVRAPFSGLVAERFVSTGEYVRPDSRVVTLMQIDPLRLELTVPESQVRHVREGQEVRFEVTAFGGERFAAVIRHLGPAMRRQSRDLVVEAVVENAEQRLRPGMFAVAQVAIGEDRLPVLPEAALRFAGSSARVFVLNQGRTEERVVRLGEKTGAGYAVLSGVEPGERIVARLSDEVRDGVRVE